MNPLTEQDIDQALIQRPPTMTQRMQPYVRSAMDDYAIPAAGIGLGGVAGAVGMLGKIQQVPRMAMTIK